jgi:hypothetical protein
LGLVFSFRHSSFDCSTGFYTGSFFLFGTRGGNSGGCRNRFLIPTLWSACSRSVLTDSVATRHCSRSFRWHPGVFCRGSFPTWRVLATLSVLDYTVVRGLILVCPGHRVSNVIEDVLSGSFESVETASGYELSNLNRIQGRVPTSASHTPQHPGSRSHQCPRRFIIVMGTPLIRGRHRYILQKVNFSSARTDLSWLKIKTLQLLEYQKILDNRGLSPLRASS